MLYLCQTCQRHLIYNHLCRRRVFTNCQLLIVNYCELLSLSLRPQSFLLIIFLRTSREYIFKSSTALAQSSKLKQSPHKDTKNLRNNDMMRVKFDKWLVHTPFYVIHHIANFGRRSIFNLFHIPYNSHKKTLVFLSLR